MSPTEPVVARPAATVVLLRDAPDPPPGRAPLQVFLQRRVQGMAFAGGMTVFPGGGVDPADRPDPDGWAGPGPRWWAGRLGCEPERAGALVVAAVREIFEECGVLLASPRDGGAELGPELAGPLALGRGDVVARRRTLGELLARAGLVLRADRLQPWSRWITPAGNPRRYDTVFFTAILPAGQRADAATTEAVEATWWYPADALRRRHDGDIALMSPTRCTLEQVAGFADAAAVQAAAARRMLAPVAPDDHAEGQVAGEPGDPAVDQLAPGMAP